MAVRHPNLKFLAEKAQAALGAALSDGEIRAGQFMSMSELSDFLDYPIASIRDAVKWASAQGVLTTLPQRGVQVMDLNPTVLRDCLDFGLMFDQEGARRWLTRNDAGALKTLHTKHVNLLDQIKTKDYDTALGKLTLGAETALHDYLAAGLDNPLLVEAYEANKLRTIVIKNAQPLRKETIKASITEQTAVLDALCQRDAGLAVTALRTHYDETAKRWGLS